MQIWARWEVLKLVQVAWRNEYYGLAALMAVAWDSQLSPVDNRSSDARLRPAVTTSASTSQSSAHQDRTAAAATLTTWSLAILIAYLKQFGAELMDNTPLFWTRGGGRSAATATPGNGAATMAAAGTSRRGRTPRAR